MAKISLADILSGFNLTKINDNFKKIQDALNNQVLFRDNPTGEDNTLKHDIDMNGKKLYNLAAPTGDSHAARLQDVKNAIAGVGGYTANLINFTPQNGLTSTNVQGAVEEAVRFNANRTIKDKSNDVVSVFDFMSEAQKADVRSRAGLIDVTNAWEAAQLAGGKIILPAGVHRITNFRPRQGKVFVGEGYRATIIKQGDPNQYAFNALSDASVGPGHLWEIGLINVGVTGPSATVAAVNVEANGAYSVQNAVFDYATDDVYQALRIWCPDAANVYNCYFKVASNIVKGIPAVRTQGAYNTYNFFLTSLAGKALDSWSSSSFYEKVITENAQEYNGFDNEIRNPKVEYWSGAASSFAAIRLNGTNNRVYNFTINGVPNSKANAALQINGGTRQTIIGGWILGDYATDRVPQYSISIGSGSKGTIVDVHSTSPVKADYVGWNTLKGWDFLGDCSTVFSYKRTPNIQRYGWSFVGQGGTVTVQDYQDMLYLQTFGVTAVTIVLPPNPEDGQVFRVSSTLAISGITWNPGSGKTVDGQIPTSLPAGGSTAMMYFGSQGQSRWVPCS